MATIVKDDRDPPAIGGMVINLVRAVFAIKNKPVAVQRGNNFASSNVSKLSIADAH